MPKNKYFIQTDGSNTNEIDLIKDLYKESIEISGQEVRYFPKQILSSNNVFGEDIFKFDKYYKVVVMLNTPDSVFENRDDIFSKFMTEHVRDLTIYISIKEYEEVLGIDLSLYKNPKIGDIFYFDFTNQLYEITYVTDESPTFPLGSRIAYEIKLKKYAATVDEFDITEDEILNNDLKDLFEEVEQKDNEVKDGWSTALDDYSLTIINPWQS